MSSDRSTQTSEDEINGQAVQGKTGSNDSQKNCPFCKTCEHCQKDCTTSDCQCPDCHKFVEAENSRSLETNENESQDYQLEYHNTKFSEHEMEVDGVILKERKEITTIRNENQSNLGQTEVKKHIRTMGNQTLTIHQQMILNESGEKVEGEKHIFTEEVENMDESEIPSFLQRWYELWNLWKTCGGLETYGNFLTKKWRHRGIQNPDTGKN